MKEKNKFIGFHGGNPRAISVYNKIKCIIRIESENAQRPVYAWEVIQASLDAFELQKEIERRKTDNESEKDV